MKLILALAAASSFVLAFPAIAQSAKYGSRIQFPAPAEPDWESKLSDEDMARVMVDDFAICTLRSSRRVVTKALELPPASEESFKALAVVAQPACLRDSKLGMPPSLLRGALYRARILDEFKGKPIEIGQSPFNPAELVDDLENSNQRRYVAAQNFASCVVRDAPETVAAFVTARAGSIPEADALTDVIPNLGPCLSEGIEVKFSVSALRADLAEALYREMAAAEQDIEI